MCRTDKLCEGSKKKGSTMSDGVFGANYSKHRSSNETRFGRMFFVFTRGVTKFMDRAIVNPRAMPSPISANQRRELFAIFSADFCLKCWCHKLWLCIAGLTQGSFVVFGSIV